MKRLCRQSDAVKMKYLIGPSEVARLKRDTESIHRLFDIALQWNRSAGASVAGQLTKAKFYSDQCDFCHFAGSSLQTFTNAFSLTIFLLLAPARPCPKHFFSRYVAICTPGYCNQIVTENASESILGSQALIVVREMLLKLVQSIDASNRNIFVPFSYNYYAAK